MTRTVYQITRIRDTKLGQEVRTTFDIPMNSPVMFVRTKRSRLAVKHLGGRHPRTIIEPDPDQVTLL